MLKHEIKKKIDQFKKIIKTTKTKIKIIMIKLVEIKT